MKVVVNRCFGGFGLSEEARAALGVSLTGMYRLGRNDPRLVEVVESLGEASYGAYSQLWIAEIPDDAHWYVCEYDGSESVLWSLSPIHEDDEEIISTAPDGLLARTERRIRRGA